MNKRFQDVSREPRVRINERIRCPEIRVIDQNNEQLGVMSSRQAFLLAKERGLDLVEVAPNAHPPVCRIIDYGKYKYEQEKQERENKKRHRQMELKGIQLRPGTDEHDLETKIRNTKRFLMDGDKVKVTLRFRRREITHPEIAQRAMQKVIDETASVGIVEKSPAIEGMQMIMILAPKANSEKKDETPQTSKPAETKKGGQPESAKDKNVQNSSETV